MNPKQDDFRNRQDKEAGACEDDTRLLRKQQEVCLVTE